MESNRSSTSCLCHSFGVVALLGRHDETGGAGGGGGLGGPPASGGRSGGDTDPRSTDIQGWFTEF